MLGIGCGIPYCPKFSGGFDPLSLSPAFWIDATDGATLFQDSALTTPAVNNADPVGGWKDKSGFGIHVKQATASQRPTLILASQNGKNVIRFDGVDDLLASTAVAVGVSTNVTFVLVAKPNATTGGKAPLMNGTGSTNGMGLSTSTNGTAKIGRLRGGTGWDDTTTGAVTTWNTYILAQDGSGSGTLYFNGTALSPTLTGAINPPTTRVTIAAHDGTSGTSCSIDIGEAYIFPSLLSSTDRGNLQTYLKNKWGTP